MKQLLVGRSGRKSRAHATLKHGSENSLSQKSFGWNNPPVKLIKKDPTEIPTPACPTCEGVDEKKGN
jgi:hypothetical protein